MTHPTWCARTHEPDAPHRSDRLTVEVPHEEGISACLVADLEYPAEPWAEVVTYYRSAPILDPSDPAVLGAIILPATHLAELAVTLLELAARIPGGTA